MGKTTATLDNLKKSLKYDLESHIGVSNDLSKRKIREIIKRISSFSDFNRELKNVVMISKMSLEEQKVETLARIEEETHRNSSSSTALFMSLIAIVLSFFSTVYNVVINDILQNLQRNSSEGVEDFYIKTVLTMCVSLFAFVVLAYFYSLSGVRTQNKNYKRISYFTVKLACIEKEQQEQINEWRKVKYEIRLKEK